jgi:hypothetical protein
MAATSRAALGDESRSHDTSSPMSRIGVCRWSTRSNDACSSGVKVVSQQTGELIGAGSGILRTICHVLDSLICYIGWLLPLWDAKKDTLAEFRQAAQQSEQTIEKLSQLVDRVDKLLASPDLDARAGKLRTVVDSLQGGVQQTVDRAFWWVSGIAVVTAFLLGAAIAFGLSWHKAMERRGAAKRRAHRKTA